MSERFLARCTRRLTGTDPSDRTLILAALATLFVGTALAVIGKALEVAIFPTAMADFLSGHGGENVQDTRIILDAWTDRPHEVLFVAWLYLAIDTILLLPSYAILGIAFARRLNHQLYGAKPRELVRGVVVTAIIATVVLGFTDLCENAFAFAVLFTRDDVTYFPDQWGLLVHAMQTANKAKNIVLWTTIFLFLLLVLFWYFNSDRTGLRKVLPTIIWRTRYTLGMLVFFAALTLASDQTRDAVVGLAQFRENVGYVWVLAIFVLTAGAILSFSSVTWLWTRLILRATSSRRMVVQGALCEYETESEATRRQPVPSHPPSVYLFVRWWVRVIGTIPLFIVVWLCALAVRDAVRAGGGWTAALMAFFAGGLLVVAAAQLWSNHRRRSRHLYEYYEDPTSYQEGLLGEIKEDKYKLFVFRSAPVWIPLVALLIMVLLRGVSLYLGGTGYGASTAPVTLAVLALAMTVWTSALGFVAIQSLRQLVPWVLILLVVVGVFGIGGLTENHRVWTAAFAHAPTSGEAGLRLRNMFLAQLALAVFAGGGLLWIVRRRKQWAWAIGVMVVGTCATMYFADRYIPRGHTGAPVALPSRPTLDDALAQWLQQFCASTPECMAHSNTGGVPVYFVSAEGGGIRAAYWTALVLAELSRVPKFIDRTFSLSGVSGGSVGEAVWFTCLEGVPRSGGNDTAEKMHSCVDPLGSTDLLTPLLSAMLFEDVVGRIVPTSWCKTPGCGFLDRGSWFEAAMERARPSLGTPIGAGRSGGSDPHLFLNSTWVESGERAIASDVEIDWEQFPTARDQLNKIGGGMALSTAAHNSARFPYANALGAVRPWRCKSDGTCGLTGVTGHLADGGYFDNSGAHTTSDILRAFERCLGDESEVGPCRKQEQIKPPFTQKNWPAHLRWLRANLVPQVIMIRNGMHTKEAAKRDSEEEHCKPGSSDDIEEWDKNPAAPRCAETAGLYIDFVGPIITALNAVGTGSNGLVSESHLEIETLRVRRALRPASTDAPNQSFPPTTTRAATNTHRVKRVLLPASADNPIQSPLPAQLASDRAFYAVVQFDLSEEDILFPLGWYLSGRARRGMQNQCTKQIYSSVVIEAKEPEISNCRPRGRL